jgi:hypothetical protein
MNKSQSQIRPVLVVLLVVTVGAFCILPKLAGDGPAPAAHTMGVEKQLSLSLDIYRQMLGRYPTGENASVVRMLGKIKETQMFLLTPNSTNRNGEIVDPWKQAYKFNFDGTNSYTISSAGYDKKFGTKDAIVFNSLSCGFVKP